MSPPQRCLAWDTTVCRTLTSRLSIMADQRCATSPTPCVSAQRPHVTPILCRMPRKKKHVGRGLSSMRGYVSYGKSRSKNGATISGAYHFQYGVLRKWSFLANRLTLRGGAQAEFLGGFIYNTRNGNNPAQARALIDIGSVAMAEYALKGGNADGKGRITVAYEASCPLFGLTFSPNYGQSYYEIFNEGNYDRNIVPTTIVSMPSLRQQLTFTFCLSRINLSVGYLGDYRQLQVNNLKQHIYSSMFMFGMTHSFYAGRRKP